MAGHRVDAVRLSEARDDALLTLEQVGDLAGVHPRTVHNLERGKTPTAYGRTLRKIARVLDVDWSELVSEEEGDGKKE